MRPLDWLTAGLAVLVIAAWLAEQFAAAWRDRQTSASTATTSDGLPHGQDDPAVPPGPRTWPRRPAAGRQIAAGGQQLNSPRFSCSPAGTSPAGWDAAIGQPAVPPQPAESWPQPSLN
jgi:hypothetical protein